MKKLLALLILLFASPAFADVVMTFDSDTEGAEYNNGTGTVTWANVDTDGDGTGDEGMLCLQSDGGWEGSLMKLDGFDLGTSGANAEIDAALANGGTITFDVFVLEADQTYSAAPGWFELVAVPQGEISGWDQEVLGIGLGAAQWPLTGGSYSTDVIMNILPGAATGDGDAQYDATDAWRNFHIGLNNDGANMTNAVVYIDNLTFAAFDAVPEPSSMAAILLVGGLFGIRRRRN